MIHKRPFVDEDSYEGATKFPRRLECIDHLGSIAPLDNCFQRRLASDGHGKGSLSECKEMERFANDSDLGIPSGSGKDFESATGNGFPHFLWINNGILEATNLSLFPEYFDHEHQLRALLQPDEVFSALDYPFQKPVLIGPEHQAHIPEWHPRGAVNSSNQSENSDPQAAVAHSSSLGGIVNDDHEQNLMGTCVIPMPQQELYEYNRCVSTETECRCLDGGSISCVRQHVTEARQKLRDTLGDEVFAELGFCDMGEEVAKKWTDVEQQTFHEVVISNPVSLGKNFWEHLSATFPTRTRKKIVSYYFNVYMLQKRAEQNRFDSLNIDSDNDEWQRSEVGMVGEDEDSVLESPTGQYTLTDHQEVHAMNRNEYVEDEHEVVASRDDTDNVVDGAATDQECEEDVDDISGFHSLISDGDCSGGPVCTPFNGVCGNRDDYDAQDDSCTSYEEHRDNCCGPLDREADERHSNQD